MTDRLNILWIVSDHQVHATRPAGFDRFPLQNALARLGIEYRNARSALPICSPARASMLTGLYPHAHGLTENDGRFGGREGLDDSDWMIHRPLLESGYRCGWFGKWHVDNQRSAQDYGFEGFSLPGYGYPYATPEYRDYLERYQLDEPVARIHMGGECGTLPGEEIRLTERPAWFDYESGVATLDGPVEASEAYFVTDLAARWIDEIGDQPFFLRVDTWGPHPPYLLGAPFVDMLASEAIELPRNFYSDLANRPQHHRDYRGFWDETLHLDPDLWQFMYRSALEHVIQVETALCRLLECIDLSDTVVIFNSDHGDAVGSNGAVANKGGLMAEATMRIPLLMAGAGLPAGESCDHLASNLDLVPTVSEICGIRSAPNFHGRSLLSAVENSADVWRRGFMAQHYGLYEYIVQRAWYQQDWKLVLQPDGFRELYRLSEDPDEMDNLAYQQGYEDKVEELSRELYAAMNTVGDADFPAS